MSPSGYHLGLKLTNVSISPNNTCYRPSEWPPTADWVVCEDEEGNPISLWSDPEWDFTVWAGKSFKLDFAGARHNRSAPGLGPKNQDIMRLLATWLLWGPDGTRSLATLKGRFDHLRRIAVLCEREGISASDLSRFPKVVEQIPMLFANAVERKRALVLLDRLNRVKAEIGFALLDEPSLRRLSQLFAQDPEDDTEQTAYIPPRIWTYQVSRLRECLDDFLKFQSQVEDCFNFCVDAYAHNFGSLTAACVRADAPNTYLPFQANRNGVGARTGRRFYGRFDLTAQRFGIDKLLTKWVRKEGIDIKSLSAYLTLVQSAGIAYIANFTFQRKEEVASLRADCLIWEHDPVLDRIPIIRGETTKTDPDSDARWPTSPNVEVAVMAMAAIARLRMRCAIANPEVNCSDDDRANPYLFHYAFEPWASTPGGWKPYSKHPKVQSYQYVLQRYPLLFDLERIKLTEEDLIAARMFTPNLDKDGKFEIGKQWPFGYHQLRRSGGINMFASGLLSDSSIQVIMKHLTLLQTRYYGRNYSRVRFNEDFETIATTSRYEVMGKQIESLVNDRYVSPHGEQRKQEIVVNLLNIGHFKKLADRGRKGEVSFRETRLGGCTKTSACDYGGIESVARCTGGDGDKPCRDAIYDTAKQESAERQLDSVERQIDVAQPGSPRAIALQAEAQGLRNYLNAIRD